MKKNKIALVDDHKLFRDGLMEIINGFNEFEVILEAGDGKEFISKLNLQNLPDIVLLDINMKGMDGYQTAEWLKTNHPAIKVLALSMHDNEAAVIRMLRNGVKGYLLKDIKKQELHNALSFLALKGYYYSEVLTGNLIHAINNLDAPNDTNKLKEIVALNPRELEFLKLACSELTYKEIAEKMCLSSHTIEGYRDHLFTKLQIKSRVGLVLYAIRNKVFILE